MSKLINISDELYNKLTMIKGSSSYTEIIKNLLNKKSNKEAVLSLAGKGGIDSDVLIEIKKGWKRWSERYA